METQNVGPALFQEVCAAIQALDLARAEALLDQSGDRQAEWYFLKGAVYYRKGWMDEAQRHYETAAWMEPQNPEYRQAAERMRNEQTYRPDGKSFGTLCAEGACIGLGGAYMFCQVCSCCTCFGLCGCCVYGIQGMPH